jgi:hypothetical protein
VGKVKAVLPILVTGPSTCEALLGVPETTLPAFMVSRFVDVLIMPAVRFRSAVTVSGTLSVKAPVEFMVNLVNMGEKLAPPDRALPEVPLNVARPPLLPNVIAVAVPVVEMFPPKVELFV